MSVRQHLVTNGNENDTVATPVELTLPKPHQKSERGTTVTVPETWSVNKDEKTNLCNWLCANGTANDFQYFRQVLGMLHEILEETHEKPTE